MTPSASGLRLLVVDDNRDAADTFAMLLYAWGHRPTVAYDAVAGLRAAIADPPDAVLLDLAMPKRHGLQLAEDLRRTDSTKDVPLVAVTGFADRETRDRATAAGIRHYFVKPVDNDALRALLGEVRRLREDAARLVQEGQALAGRTPELVTEGRRRLNDLGLHVEAPRDDEA